MSREMYQIIQQFSIRKIQQQSIEKIIKINIKDYLMTLNNTISNETHKINLRKLFMIYFILMEILSSLLYIMLIINHTYC